MRQLIFLLLVVVVSCKQINPKVFIGTYSGYIKGDDSISTYMFEADKTLVFTTHTDEGIMTTKCEYEKKDDTLFVTTLDYYEQISKHFLTYTDTFYVSRDSCIIQKRSGIAFYKKKNKDD